LHGKAALDAAELKKVKPLFFQMMALNRFDNIKQVEPMLRSVRDEYSWEVLTNSKGDRIREVSAIYAEQKAHRSIEDKIRSFSSWLSKVDAQELTKSAINTLERLRKIIVEKLQ
jgi:hypothetical protein